MAEPNYPSYYVSFAEFKGYLYLVTIEIELGNQQKNFFLVKILC